MVATSTVSPELNRHSAEPDFLAMLPAIRRVAGYASRHLRPAAREEFMAEVVAHAFASFQRLVERGKAALAYPTVLARFAIRQVRAGRRLGGQLNGEEVLSPYAQQRNGFRVQSLGEQNSRGHWEELVVEDRKSSPAEIAACRLDFQAWLRQLDRRRRAVALRLATGESTAEAASWFGVSQGRISQFRHQLISSWEEFQGERLAAIA